MEQTYYVNLNLTTRNISPPVLAKRLEEEGIFVGCDNNGLKLSFSFMNSNEEIDLFVEKLYLFL
jgi:selenocysteine lyase/cysteine desulfurase